MNTKKTVDNIPPDVNLYETHKNKNMLFITKSTRDNLLGKVKRYPVTTVIVFVSLFMIGYHALTPTLEAYIIRDIIISEKDWTTENDSIDWNNATYRIISDKNEYTVPIKMPDTINDRIGIVLQKIPSPEVRADIMFFDCDCQPLLVQVSINDVVVYSVFYEPQSP